MPLRSPSYHQRDWLRRTFFVLFVFFFSATLGFLFSAHPEESSATTSGFSAGNIINDYTMGNYTSMSESEIQAFLKSKNPCNDTNLSKADPYKAKGINYHIKDGHFVCMADERFGDGTTVGSGESAAHIIWQAAHDYKINPQVLIVLLEKEQGLITDTWPNTTYQYKTATGFGCPDTAPCDSQYFGLKNQIRRAAALFREVLDGGWTNYPLGKNTVKYHPSTSCGSTTVNIENLATSALYRYTPYVPNAAALSGNGDGCSSYGNRNFYHYFTEWFGSTHRSPWVSMVQPRVMTATQATLRINVKDFSLSGTWLTAGENQTFDRKTNIERNGKMVPCLSNSKNPDTCVLLERLKEFKIAFPSNSQGTVVAKQYTCEVTPGSSRVNCARAANQGDYISYLASTVVDGTTYYITDSTTYAGYLADRFTTISTPIAANFKTPRYMKLVKAAPAQSLTGASCPTRVAGSIQYFTHKINLNHKAYYLTSSDVAEGGSWCLTPVDATGELKTTIKGPYANNFVNFVHPRDLKVTADTIFYDIDNQFKPCRTIKKGTTLYFDSKINIGILSFYRTRDDRGKSCVIPSTALEEVK